MNNSLKEKIEFNANYMALEYSKDDIHVIKSYGYTVAFLSKFNPHQATDKHGILLFDESGKPIIEWHYNMSIDIYDSRRRICNDMLNLTHKINVDIHMRNDSLVMIVTPDGELVQSASRKYEILRDIMMKEYVGNCLL